MNEHKRSFRVGLFVLAGIAALFTLVAILGHRHSLFHRKIHLRALFANAGGVMIGTPVRLAGVDIGEVEDIAFDDDLARRDVQVTLALSKSYRDRLRSDSTALLTSKGVLGDTVIDISVGGPTAAPLVDGAVIATREAIDLAEIARHASGAIDDFSALTRTAKARIDAVVTDQVATDVGNTIHDLSEITSAIRRGNGPAHSLLFDRTLATRIDHIGASAESAAADLQHTVHGVSDDIEHGRGTVGALLKDPTLYDDVKLLVGNARRNRLLRGLIHYTVRHDGLSAPRGAPPQAAH